VALISGDGTFFESGLLTRAGDAAEGLHIVAFWHASLPAEDSRAFAAAFESAMGRRARPGEAVFYDAVRLAAQPVWRAGAERQRVNRCPAARGRERRRYMGITGRVAFGPGSPRALVMTRVRGDSTALVHR